MNPNLCGVFGFLCQDRVVKIPCQNVISAGDYLLFK